MEVVELFRTAAQLGCKPWEVPDIPQAWINAARVVAEIESRAAEAAKQLKPSGAGGNDGSK